MDWAGGWMGISNGEAGLLHSEKGLLLTVHTAGDVIAVAVVYIGAPPQVKGT